MRSRQKLLSLAVLSWVGLLLAVSCAFAAEEAVSAEVSVRVDNKIGFFAHDFTGYDSDGRSIRLSQISDGKPLLIVPVYYKCPSICGPLIQEALKFVENSRFVAGRDFRLVFISFNPDEDADLAAQKKASFMAELERDGIDVKFLTGAQDEITQLLDSLGFRYERVDDEFNHPPAYYVLDKTLKITHVFKTILLDFPSMDLAIVDASDGRLGSFVDKVRLFCSGFDPESGRYTLVAVRVMQLGGLLTMLVLGGTLFWLWKKG